jgi:hypothetical protein
MAPGRLQGIIVGRFAATFTIIALMAVIVFAQSRRAARISGR